MCEFQDFFFTKDEFEFDFGNFREIEHKIDTGYSKPFKLRMGRTPVTFVSEEKAHVDKMKRAGVIQPSASEWASAPVLVRKMDGSYRWCVDNRDLNVLTVKDVFQLID